MKGVRAPYSYNKELDVWVGTHAFGSTIVIPDMKPSGITRASALLNHYEERYETIVLPNILSNKLRSVLKRRKGYREYKWSKEGIPILYKSRDSSFSITDFLTGVEG